MAFLQEKCLMFLMLMISCVTLVLSARYHNPYSPPKLKPLSDLFPEISFNDGFSQIFGGSNLQQNDNGSVTITLNQASGSGFFSKNRYHYGFFSASMKLPPGYTSGVVVAFYLSNSDEFPQNHDEIDFEFLGHPNGKDWTLQTNIYGNGSEKITGREEKIHLWFDATNVFHTYSIIWNSYHIVFFVDDIPIREVVFNELISPAYPSKPMFIYSTIWDGSNWATSGGKLPVDYKYAPFVASIKQMKMEGCIWDQSKQVCTNSMPKYGSLDPVEGQDFVKLSDDQRKGMEDVRKSYLTYSYCTDLRRFKTLPPECK